MPVYGQRVTRNCYKIIKIKVAIGFVESGSIAILATSYSYIVVHIQCMIMADHEDPRKEEVKLA